MDSFANRTSKRTDMTSIELPEEGMDTAQRWVEELDRSGIDTMGGMVGPDAYDEFIKNLTEEPFDAASYHGTAYTMVCLMEAKWAISEYLKKVDPLIESDLTPASEKYGELNQELNKCHEEFPMGPGEMLKEKCVKVAGHLGEAKELETIALELLGNVIDAW